jgi:hypothetical protein
VPFSKRSCHDGNVVISDSGSLDLFSLSRRENRLQPRRNTMIVATVVYDGGRTRLDCVIRNLSDGGAKLEFATVRGIPQSFDLMVPGHQPQHCRVAWRALKELGVQFMPAVH